MCIHNRLKIQNIILFQSKQAALSTALHKRGRMQFLYIEASFDAAFNFFRNLAHSWHHQFEQNEV